MDKVYREKIMLLINRCDDLQQDNEFLVNRLYNLNKIIHRSERDCRFLTERLTSYNPNWVTDDSKIGTLQFENDSSKSNDSINIMNPQKKKLKKTDPNAPKKPANPYLQFCQEQRQFVTEDISQQDLSKIFAAKWKTLSNHEKQVYVDMFEKSKKKYNEELDEYNSKH